MKRSKYGNIKTHGFDSRAEYARWLELQILQKAGKITRLRRQERYPLKVGKILVCTYVADFYYELPNGTPVVEDVKGVKTATYRIKRKLMKAVLDIDIKEVSAKDLRVRRRP